MVSATEKEPLQPVHVDAPGPAGAGPGGAVAAFGAGGLVPAIEDGEVDEACAESDASSSHQSLESPSASDVESSEQDHPPWKCYGI